MGLVDWLMERWARAERRRDACQWCWGMPRNPETSEGRYCSESCATADVAEQAWG